MMEIIDINFLEFEHLKHITQRLFNYKSSYKIHPSLDTMNTLATTKVKELESSTKNEVKEFLETVKVDTNISDSDYVKETTIDFCRTQKVKEAIVESIPFLEDANFEKVHHLFDKALRAGLDQNHGHDYLEDFTDRYENARRTAIESGWKLINDATEGGWGRGELAVLDRDWETF